jgi:hypothetical protein
MMDSIRTNYVNYSKETPLIRIMTKYHHDWTTSAISVLPSAFVIQPMMKEETKIIVRNGVFEKDFISYFKEIRYSYALKEL